MGVGDGAVEVELFYLALRKQVILRLMGSQENILQWSFGPGKFLTFGGGC